MALRGDIFFVCLEQKNESNSKSISITNRFKILIAQAAFKLIPINAQGVLNFIGSMRISVGELGILDKVVI